MVVVQLQPPEAPEVDQLRSTPVGRRLAESRNYYHRRHFLAKHFQVWAAQAIGGPNCEPCSLRHSKVVAGAGAVSVVFGASVRPLISFAAAVVAAAIVVSSLVRCWRRLSTIKRTVFAFVVS